MSNLKFLLGKDVVLRVLFNGRITFDIAIPTFVCQGCPLILLLFAVVTNPLLVTLSRLATNDDIVGLHLPYGAQVTIGSTSFDK